MLSGRQFRRIARAGVWHADSRAVEALASFEGALYLSFSRAAAGGGGEAAVILRYDARDAAWDEVWRGEPGTLGCGAMAVFGGNGERPALYAAAALADGRSRMLRLGQDGAFTALDGSGPGEDGVVRQLLPWADRLVARVVPGGTADPDRVVEGGILRVSRQPGEDAWEEMELPGGGLQGDDGATAMAVFKDRLYVAIANEERGFHLWCREAAEAGAAWQRVIGDGARRYLLNEAVTAMAAFGDGLFLACGGPRIGLTGGEDLPVPAELVRVDPQGGWELICGTPRFSPEGLKVPMSACAGGFDDPCNTVIATLAAHQDVLYAGTYNRRPIDCAQRGERHLKGGFELWASHDGEDWTRVLEPGAANPCQLGVSALLSTDAGLVLGTANFKPEIDTTLAQTSPAKKDLPYSGGFEVWLGQTTAQNG